jgi:hypothetical protein
VEPLAGFPALVERHLKPGKGVASAPSSARLLLCPRADIVPRRAMLEVAAAARGYAGGMPLCASSLLSE